MRAEKLNRTIFIKDNLEVLRGIDDKTVDLIYLDPPFNSNKNYGAPIGSKAAGSHFKDMWFLSDTDEAWWGELSEKHPDLYEIIHAVGCINGNKDKSYLIYMSMRLLEMHRILKDTGSIYLHCDYNMSHSLKLVMDSIFNKRNFKNEIVWYYYNKYSPSKRFFPRASETLFFYSKDKTYHFSPLKIKREKPKKQLVRENINGVLKNKKDTNGKCIYRISYDKKMDNVWKIPCLQHASKEWTGYPTQKPLSLLERVIKASCPEKGLVLDPFAGCASACIAAEKLQRKWIGIDLSPMAETLVKERLINELGLTSQLVKIRKDLPIKNAPKPSRDIKYKFYGLQRGYCNGCKVHFQFKNLTKDHIIPLSEGGPDTNENLQLLCGHCNSVKGKRTMEYLNAQLKKVAS